MASLIALLGSIWDRCLKIIKPWSYGRQRPKLVFFMASHFPRIIYSSFRWLFIDTLLRQGVKHSFLSEDWCSAPVIPGYFCSSKGSGLQKKWYCSLSQMVLFIGWHQFSSSRALHDWVWDFLRVQEAQESAKFLHGQSGDHGLDHAGS